MGMWKSWREKGMCGNDVKIVLLYEILKNIKLKSSLYKLKNNLCTDSKVSQWNG